MTNKKSVFNWQVYVGVVLIVTGGIFLVDQFLPIRILASFWPLLIVLFGVTFLFAMLTAGKRGSGLAIPGTIITTLGLLLFIQSTFKLWVTWSYAWALLISAAGLGILIMNFYLKKVVLRRVAGLLIGIGLTLFVVFGILFEIIIDLSGANLASSVFLGGGLVLLGLFVVFSRPLFRRARKSVAEASQSEPEVVDAEFEAEEQAAAATEDSAQLLSSDAVFSGLHFESIGEVIIVQGDTCGLKVKGGDIRDRVKIEIRDDVLTITHKSDVADWGDLSRFRDIGEIQYYVTLQDVKHIELKGAGNIRADQLAGESLRLVHAGVGEMALQGLNYKDLNTDLGGVGEVRLAGEVQTQFVELSGIGDFNAEELKSQQAEVSVSGAGSARVWVEGALTAGVSGAGSIQFRGHPEVTQSVSGLGSINPF